MRPVLKSFGEERICDPKNDSWPKITVTILSYYYKLLLLLLLLLLLSQMLQFDWHYLPPIPPLRHRDL